jgi:hypothetical protein
MFRIRFIGKWNGGRNLTYDCIVPDEIIDEISSALWAGETFGGLCKPTKNLIEFKKILRMQGTKITTIVLTTEDALKAGTGRAQ